MEKAIFWVFVYIKYEANSDKVLLELYINLIKGSSFFRNEQIKMVIEKRNNTIAANVFLKLEFSYFYQ